MDKTAKKRWIGVAAAFFVTLYLLTWTFGVPAIHNQAGSLVVAALKQSRQGLPVGAKPVTNPYCRFGPAFVIFPGLIIARVDYLIGSTGGEWGWSLYLWYGGEPKRLMFRGVEA